MTVHRGLLEAARDALAEAADPERAPGQQAYMKSALPYFGVTADGTRAVGRDVVAAHPFTTYEDWRDSILALFREATRRELWYLALHVAQARPYREYAARLESLALYEALIVEAGWWDVVDEVAAHLVGGLFSTDAAWTTAQMRAWSTDPHLWKRRTSIICQLRRKAEVDLDLLYACIEVNTADRDFFIRKAIGWALREVAKTQPDEVARYVAAHASELSPLSKREALKNLLKAGTVTAVP